MSLKIIGNSVSSIPWEDKPVNCSDIVWRFSQNPIIHRDTISCSNSIFNSAVVSYGDKFAGVFRVDHKNRAMRLHVGFSNDAISWKINPDPIDFDCGIEDLAEFEYGYDPRVTWLEDRYYVTWCNGYKNYPTIGAAWTKDFKTFHQLENVFLPFNRNGVLFPRKINGNFALLSRPSDAGHTPFGDVFYSESPDFCYWGKHRLVMKASTGWQGTKIGAGPVPLETSEGWLLIYHGVLTSCNGFVYSFGAALLDLDQPWNVRYRTEPYLLNQKTIYECVGDVPNVVFPCSILCNADTGRIAIYYGAADTVIALGLH